MSRAENRKPSNEAPDYRQTMWNALRSHPDGLTLTQLSGLSGAHRKTIDDYLCGLVAAGYVQRDEQTARMIKDAGHFAPRVRKDGSPITVGAGTMNLWRSMQHLPEFTSLDLATHSTTDTVTVTQGTAQAYCSMLLRTGYLRVIVKSRPIEGRLAVYRLVRNSGPRPPKIQRTKVVFDPNTGAIHTPGDGS